MNSSHVTRTHLKRVHYIEDHEDDEFNRCPTQWDECHKAFARPAGPGNKPRKGTEEWKEAQVAIYQKVWRVLFPSVYFPALEPPSMPFDLTEPPSRGLVNQVKTLFCALQHADALEHRPTDNVQQNLKHAFATMSTCSQPDEVAYLRSIEEATISAAVQDLSLWLRGTLEGDLPPSVTAPEPQELVSSLGPSQHQGIAHLRTLEETPVHDLSWSLDALECDPPITIPKPEPQEPVKLECRAFEAIGFLQSLPEHEAYRAGHHLTVQETPVGHGPSSGVSTALEPHELGIYMKGTVSDARFFARVLPSHQNYRPGRLVVITMTPPQAMGCDREDGSLGAIQSMPIVNPVPSYSPVSKGNSLAVPDCPSMGAPLKHDHFSFWSNDDFNLYGDLDVILNFQYDPGCQYPHENEPPSNGHHPDITGEEAWLLDSLVKPLS
ncbi:hypothetical protein PG999_000307 [Apiospora kogelbergensis]|uniref:Uncharacterized protein n=1 Tax=Apiospora kogelbergensis TaxID=1337665 RepID=A0AAW0RBF9_9PEZI